MRAGILGTLCSLALLGCGEDEASGEGGGGAPGSGGASSGGSVGALGAGGSGTASGGSGGSQSGGSGGGTGGGPAPGCVVDLDCAPEPLAETGDFGADCVARINQFRVGCHCLPPLERWTEAEACAAAQATADQASGDAHGSWGPDGVCDGSSGELAAEFSGGATNECPGYDSVESVLEVCLAQMYGEGVAWEQALGRPPEQEDYGPCAESFQSCYVNYGHFIAMTKETHGKVACGITDSGSFWAVQNYQ
jgi:hypothetical protein